jgi:hypothetical protein
MQWARANGCPWKDWSGKTCKLVCVAEKSKGMQQLRDAMMWAHAAGCPCDRFLHCRAVHHMSDEHTADKRELRLFRLCFCVQWYELAVVAVMFSVLTALMLKFLAPAFCPLAEMDVGSRLAGIVLFVQFMAVLLFGVVSVLLEEFVW